MSIFTFISKRVARGLWGGIQRGAEAPWGFDLAWGNEQWHGKGVSWALIREWQAQFQGADTVAFKGKEPGSQIALGAMRKSISIPSHSLCTLSRWVAHSPQLTKCTWCQQTNRPSYQYPKPHDGVTLLHNNRQVVYTLEDREMMKMDLVFQFRQQTLGRKHFALSVCSYKWAWICTAALTPLELEWRYFSEVCVLFQITLGKTYKNRFKLLLAASMKKGYDKRNRN